MIKRILGAFALLSVMTISASGWRSEASAGAKGSAKATEAVECAVGGCDPGACPLPCPSPCVEEMAASCCMADVTGS